MVLRWWMVISPAGRQFAAAEVGADPFLHRGYQLLGLLLSAVDQQPPWALRDTAAYEEDDQAEDHAEGEGQPPADVRREEGGVQRDDRQQGAADRAQPEAAVDDQVDPAPVLGGDQLVDRGVDGRVLAADAEAREEAEGEEPPGLEGDGGQGRGPQIHRQGDHEQLLAAEAVGEAAEEQRPDARAGDIEGGRGAGDLRGGDRQAAAGLGEASGDVADDRDFQTVEDPYRAEADHHGPVPA